MAARRIGSRAEAAGVPEAGRAPAGVRKVLLIGGDVPAAAGPYADGAALLRDGLLAECGMQQVGLAGYPEGHPRIASAALAAALAEKLALAAAQGLGAYVVTQFSFAPNRIVEYCADLARRAPDGAGLRRPAGPDQPAHAAALRAALRRQRLAARAAGAGHGRGAPLHPHRPHRAARRARALLPHRRASNVVGVHLYSFGGVATTAAWMNARITARG